MKSSIIRLLVCVCFLYAQESIYSQCLESNVSHNSNIVHAPIQLSKLMKPALDTVFPDVQFRWIYNKTTMGDGFGSMQGILDSTVYNLLSHFNALLSDQISKRKRAHVPEEQIIKAFACLYFLEGQRKNMQYEIKKITVNPCNYKYSKWDTAKWPDELKTLNYQAVIEYDTTTWNFYWRKDVFNYQVRNNIIISGCGSREGKDGKIQDIMLFKGDVVKEN